MTWGGINDRMNYLFKQTCFKDERPHVWKLYETNTANLPNKQTNQSLSNTDKTFQFHSGGGKENSNTWHDHTAQPDYTSVV